MIHPVNKEYPVWAWWSGGVASAIVCKLCVEWFRAENVRIIFIDPAGNEADDTYIFKADCEKWYGKQIETITSSKYKEIKEVWYEYLSLNTGKGAICSKELKIKVRQDFSTRYKFSYQAFGFDVNEMDRAQDMAKNNYHLNPIFPLIAVLYDKKRCIREIQKANNLFLTIRIPSSYLRGYSNNNCDKTGCVQGGIGYWQKIQREEPPKFEAMAKVEHELTDLKGKPVTICKDQSKGGGLVFLKPHPKYPHIKDISMMKGRPPEKLMECNGFCKQKQ